MKKKSISIIGTVGIPAKYGGFETLVENLSFFHKDKFIEYTLNVYCSSKEYENETPKYKNTNLRYIPIHANGMQSVLYDFLSIFHAIYKKDHFLLILGVSGGLFFPLVKIFTNIKIVTNIDGIEWKRAKWNRIVKLFLKLSEYFAVKFSDVVIADNEIISKYIDQTYQVKSKTIAYGGDHALLAEETNNINTENSFYLALCRIEPENNIDMILESFSSTGLSLWFIGNWNNSSYGRNLRNKYNNKKNISLLDPIYDINKLYEIRTNAIGYIHGHSAGGTNPSLVEMMFFEIPIYAYDCNFNRESTHNQAFFFKNSADLSGKILGTDPLESRSSARNLKDTAEKEYTWNVIAKKYFDIFDGF